MATQSRPVQRTTSAIAELRQYTLLPGQRDVLIDIFEREFIEGQEAVGIEIIDHFRDYDRPDRFVWFRGFPDMPTRAQASAAFYAGPIWEQHSDAANATMLDSTNVLLLRPAHASSGYPIAGERPPAGHANPPSCVVVATIYHLTPSLEDGFPAFFDVSVAPALADVGAEVLAGYVTEHSPNNYPRLPIREEEHVFVWFARFPDLAAHEAHCAALARSRRWSGDLSTELAQRLDGAPEVLRLVPTARSRMRA